MECLCPCGHEPTGSIVPVSLVYFRNFRTGIIILSMDFMINYFDHNMFLKLKQNVMRVA